MRDGYAGFVPDTSSQRDQHCQTPRLSLASCHPHAGMRDKVLKMFHHTFLQRSPSTGDVTCASG
jgi:hypothetical protein